MPHPLFAETTSLQARALYIGQRIDLRSLASTHRLAASPLTIAEGQDGCAVLFRYGVVVLFGLSAVEEMNFLNGLRPLLSEPIAEPEIEAAELELGEHRREGVEQGRILLNQFGIERLQLVADVLAKSALLSRYEKDIAASFDRIEPFAADLRRRGRGSSQARELIRHIGDNLTIQTKMVGRAEIMEKPELLWERPDLERLYLRLEAEYELRERHLALERKLELTSRTATTLLELLNTRRSLRVEWYIVILILVDILLSLYKMIF